MTERVSLAALLQMLEGDREVLDVLRELALLPREADSFAGEEVEWALVARTLLRELEVNPPGVEIILRLRSENLAIRRQVAELIRQLRERPSRG
jgi:hypothetical protein